MTEKLIQQVEDLFTHLRLIRSLLDDLNSKVDYIIEIYGISQEIIKSRNLEDWEDDKQ